MGEIEKLGEQEIIQKLRQMHNGGSKDPEILSLARLHDFNLKHSNAAQIPKLQGRLLGICMERGDSWTEI